MSLQSRIAAVCLCAFVFLGRAIPQQEIPTISVTRTEVLVPVTVTDDRGKFVTDLQAKDFRILDEGKPQRIEFFSHAERQPIVVGFLLDLSNANKIHWKRFQEAAKELVWNLLPGDKRYSGYLITYSNDAQVAVNTTWDADKLTSRIDRVKPGAAR